MAETDVRVEIGFEGGLILSMRLPQVEWAKLEAALDSPENRVALASEDVTTHVVMSRVCYVKHESHVGKIGF